MSRFWSLSTLVLAGTTLLAQGSDPQTPTFRAIGELVPVYVTVTDRSDRLVTSLTEQQFSVRDNGHPQTLTLFDNSPQPIRLVVLVDVSGSMYGNLPLVQASGRELFQRLLPDDLATVGTFGRDITIAPRLTRDAARLT